MQQEGQKEGPTAEVEAEPKIVIPWAQATAQDLDGFKVDDLFAGTRHADNTWLGRQVAVLARLKSASAP
jgi:hypothetical protein